VPGRVNRCGARHRVNHVLAWWFPPFQPAPLRAFRDPRWQIRCSPWHLIRKVDQPRLAPLIWRHPAKERRLSATYGPAFSSCRHAAAVHYPALNPRYRRRIRGAFKASHALPLFGLRMAGYGPDRAGRVRRACRTSLQGLCGGPRHGFPSARLPQGKPSFMRTLQTRTAAQD